VEFAVLLGLTMPALAHHSFAMFDRGKVVTIEGVVRRLDWTNPHVFIAVEVAGKQGEPVQYKIECPSINMLMHQGWKPSSIKVGDRIKARLTPLKNGQPAGLLIEVTLPSGALLKG
jgi:hypothetical protein